MSLDALFKRFPYPSAPEEKYQHKQINSEIVNLYPKMNKMDTLLQNGKIPPSQTHKSLSQDHSIY